MHRFLSLLAALLILAMTATVAFGANVHLKGRSGPTFTDLGLSLSSTGTLTGLGNGDIIVTLTTTGTPTVVCTNPSGSNEPPGQNPASITLDGSQVIPAGSIKNGNVTFNVVTASPQQPANAKDAGCPSNQWTATITDVAFGGHSATLTVWQGGVIVFQQTYTVPTNV